MTYKQIEKEFDDNFMNNGVNGLLDDKFQSQQMLQVKSFLKQSFIKYLQSDIERWIKVFDYHNEMSNERHSTMRNVARTEIENLKAQIKELEI